MPKSHDRGSLLSTEPNADRGDDASTTQGAVVEIEKPDFFAEVGLMGMLRVGATMFMNSFSIQMFSVEYSTAELDNMKAAAMEPLKGKLRG